MDRWMGIGAVVVVLRSLLASAGTRIRCSSLIGARAVLLAVMLVGPTFSSAPFLSDSGGIGVTVALAQAGGSQVNVQGQWPITQI